VTFGARAAGIYLLVLACGFAAANVAVSLIRIRGDDLPEYGSWTGVLEMERKLRLLREFAREGDVDALILSSSIGDMGVSAETLSEELSAHHSRSFRVFNFSVGGADLTTYALLYRYARLVAKPRQVWVVTPLSVASPQIGKGTLDEQLLSGPAARYRDFPPLLWVSYRFFELPLVRHAAAVRDVAVYQRFASRPATNLDLYHINRHGDMVSWTYNVTQYPNAAGVRRDRRDEVLAFVDPSKAERRFNAYFNPRTRAAIEDLRGLATGDGASITVIAIDGAASLSMRDRDFLEASQRFFEPLARFLGAGPAIDVREAFEPMPYMVSDLSHLNAIGAEAFSTLLAARMARKPQPSPVSYSASQKIMERLPDPTWTNFTALVPKRRGDPPAALELRYLQNWGVTPLEPGTFVHLALRTPDDKEAVVPACALSSGTVVADMSGLELDPEDQILVTQLVVGRGGMGGGVHSLWLRFAGLMATL